METLRLNSGCLDLVRANLREETDSGTIESSLTTVTTRQVLQLPERLFFISMVRGLSRQEWNPSFFFNILMHRPRVVRLLFMFFASSAFSSVVPDFTILSEPARSTKRNFEHDIMPPFDLVRFRVMMLCERLDRLFRLCDLAERVTSIISIT